MKDQNIFDVIRNYLFGPPFDVLPALPPLDPLDSYLPHAWAHAFSWSTFLEWTFNSLLPIKLLIFLSLFPALLNIVNPHSQVKAIAHKLDKGFDARRYSKITNLCGQHEFPHETLSLSMKHVVSLFTMCCRDCKCQWTILNYLMIISMIEKRHEWHLHLKPLAIITSVIYVFKHQHGK